MSSQPNLDSYLLPDGRRRGWRTAPSFLSCSTASYQEPDRLGEVLAKWRRERNAWASGRRLRVAIRRGFSAHVGERARWLRVSQRGVDPLLMARRWSLFVRDDLKPAYPWWSDWIRVTGVTQSGIAHVHVVWFGGYLPHDWLVMNWGRFTRGDDAVWVDEVKGQNGAGVSKYLSRQFVEYLSGQGVRAKWSKSTGWLAPGASRAVAAAGVTLPTAPSHGNEGGRGAETGKAALEFVQGSWYRGHDGPQPRVYRDGSGRLHSMLSVRELVEVGWREEDTAG